MFRVRHWIVVETNVGVHNVDMYLQNSILVQLAWIVREYLSTIHSTSVLEFHIASLCRSNMNNACPNGLFTTNKPQPFYYFDTEVSTSIFGKLDCNSCDSISAPLCTTETLTETSTPVGTPVGTNSCVLHTFASWGNLLFFTSSSDCKTSCSKVATYFDTQNGVRPMTVAQWKQLTGGIASCSEST